MRIKRIILLFVLLHLIKTSFSQNNFVDSLNTILANAKDDTIKTRILNTLGTFYYHKGNYSESLKHYLASLKTSKEKNDRPGMSSAYNGIGIVYEALGNYTEATAALFASLKISESSGDLNKAALAYINIALIYMDQGNYADAKANCLKALDICKKKGDKIYLAYTYNTLGLVYYYDENYDEALKNHLSALKLREEMNDKKETAGSYCNIGVIYYAEGLVAARAGKKDSASLKYSLALRNYLSCLNLMEQMRNEQGTAGAFVNLGSLYTQLKNYKFARAYIDSGIALYETIGSREGMKECYNALMELDSTTGNFKEAYLHHKLFIVYRDSLLNQESTRKTTQIQMQHDFNKKSEADSIKTAEHAARESIKHEEEIKQQRIYTYGGIAGFALMLVIAGISFSAFKTKQKANLVISAQKSEVEKQKNIIEGQKLLVEEHQKEIIDSITYAKRIQQAILPPEKLIKQYLPGSFMLYKPKDIVAGDFYWMHINSLQYAEGSQQTEKQQTDHSVLIAAADCTGHGVPGALVSVVCSNALNRSTNEFGLKEPGEILDKTRELVLETFSKSGEDVKDGMDISLLSIEPIKESTKLQKGKLVIPKGQSLSDVMESMKRYKVQWAGANNPLWYFKNGQPLEITAHKQAIGKTEYPVSFPTHTIELGKGDALYLFTDGFADQFGGPKGKKFKYKQLQELLLANVDKSSEEQIEIIGRAFDLWKGDLEQVDDVCIIGIKL